MHHQFINEKIKDTFTIVLKVFCKIFMQFAAEKEVIHSWQKIDPASARYPPEITPLILAAQRNNYEILKLLLDRGATLPMPHDIRCGCADCLRSTIGKTNK